ncbi:uncharacterized protein [Euphorbia lathyris]|uniref:uncharacterized protein n=1 Tax=Euphorbia lathyris TaxID=212925 RepID=UPI00331436A8
MDFDALMLITAAEKQPQQQQLSMCYLRKFFHMVRVLHLMVLSCTFFCLATCGPCLVDGLQKSTEHDGCGSYKDDHAAGFHDIIVADASAGYDLGSQMTRIGIKNICTASHSFCFPSTLPDFSSKEHKPKAEDLEVPSSQSDNLSSIGSTYGGKGASNRSWFSDSGMFELINGQTVSCSMHSMEGANKLSTMQTSSDNQNDLSSCRGPLLISRSMNSEMTKPNPFDVSLSPYVEINPPVLDYGRKNLYCPSVAFLTITNMCNDSILHVYEPFSTDLQFYHCNFSELHLGPGEVASICLVFLPRSLGLSSAHLILQTSFGGFLVEVKGYAVESPYKISPVVSLDTDSSGRLIKNLSLFNPFNENLYVTEISAWISVSQGNISYQTEAACTIEKFQDSDRPSLLIVKDWLVVNSAQAGLPLMAMRPHENWEIGPRGSEIVIEIEFPFESDAQIVGAFYMQLARLSRDKSDTILVPVEIDLDGKFAHNGITASGSVSVSLEALVPCDASNTVVSISLRNGASHLLSVVKISEFATVKDFLIKYVEGLLLFPGTVTQVATIACTQLLAHVHDSTAEMVNVNENCKLVVLTNDSSNPEIEIPCQNIIGICSRHHKDSTIGLNLLSEKSETGNMRSGSLDSDTWLPSKILGLETIEADEFVLENWKSHGTSRSMSVLDDHEVVFPVVQVGTQQSKWITVKNPSEHPVVMQLILNSGEIVDECRGTDVLLLPISLGSLVQNGFPRTSYGFSMADGAKTEALVQPHGKASFGPIFFHPSNRCGWTSTALIRNNLSGVEWLSLKGYGGSLSLVVSEGSKPVQSIEFNLGLPFPLNISSPDMLSHMEETNRACSQPLSKELYAKNTGDLPLEVKSIKVSGAECRLDGFKVHNCNGFSLEPGESTKLLISYQSDFYAAVLQRDLELALASGILVIPMKASLSLFMFNVCKKSMFWIRLKKFSAVVLLSASLMFLILFCMFPQLINFGSQDYLYKSSKSSITTETSSGKSARLHRNHRNSKFSLAADMDSLLKSAAEGTLKQTSDFDYPESPLGEPVSFQNGMPTPKNHNAAQTTMSKPAEAETSNVLEASQPCSLTVRIGKEKGRRRRKRKGVAGLFEVSSSQSGNSTPSSPLSPTSVTVNCNRSPSPDTNHVVARNPFTHMAATVHIAEPSTRATVTESKLSEKRSSNMALSAAPEQLSSARKTSNKLASATSPSNLLYSSSPASTSRVAPHARAPGPKHENQKKVEEKLGNEHVYDIWGDHFSGIHLVGSSKDVRIRKSIVTENSSSSFFVRGPQALVTKSPPKNGSCFQEEG